MMASGAAVRPAQGPEHRAKSTLGGVVFGVVGVALPLTMFTGSDQLKTVLQTMRGPSAWGCSSPS